MLHIALEVPLATLRVGGLGQGDGAGMARVEMLHEFIDGAAFARGVAPLEQDDDALPLAPDPALQLDQLDLERLDLQAVGLAVQPLVVGVTATLQRLGCDVRRQDGVVDIEARQLLAGADLLEQQAVGHAPPHVPMDKGAPQLYQQNGGKHCDPPSVIAVSPKPLWPVAKS